MQPASSHPLLPSDSVTRFPYNSQSDDNSQHVRLVARPSSTRSPPPMQFSGNMLGARARAAEYNAAKAASARQQASREAEEQNIPRPAPISLSAFTRNASTSRNKGAKTFKPLILSEEEDEENPSRADTEKEVHQPSSPYFESTNLPRAASLPPPQSMMYTQNEATQTVQTPFRYREVPFIPYAPRAMLAEDTYGFHPYQGMTIHAHHLQSQYMQNMQGFVTPPVIPTPHVGWYTSSEYFGCQYSYPYAGSTPNTSAQFIRPIVQQAQSFDLAPVPVARPPKATSTTSSVDDSPEITKSICRLGGPTLHVFGPDDLSPAKMETKHHAREKQASENAEVQLPFVRLSTRSKTSMLKPQEAPVENEQAQFEQSELEMAALALEKSSSTIKDLLAKHDIIAPTRPRRDTIPEHALERMEGATKTVVPTAHLPREADWPYLERPREYHNRNVEDVVTPSKPSAIFKADIANEKIKMMLLESMRAKTESPLSVPRPPRLEQSRPENGQFRELESEQITNIKFPLVDMKSSEWLEVRMPTEAERDRMRLVCHAVRTSSVSDKYQDQWEDKRGVEREDLEHWLSVSEKQYSQRRFQIEELASEMQYKWEHGGSSGLASINKADAQQHAAIVRAVGSIMSTLNMQTEDSSGFYHRGARPYCAPPAYAIEKSVGLDKDGKSTSLFESQGDSNRFAPPRLARDPRFRPQLGETIALDEGRIPRMFVSRRI